MIPLKLTLHNFMCYRDPDSLDFTGLHLACLSGNNGHGKSALLDAMTWVLWGKARSNQADELITLGEDDMWVDFELALGSSRYRVVRKRERRGRSGKSDLQLQVWQDGAEWRAITEPTIRETEQRIVDLLRMDYDTFINSAFLVQGRADEFTVKPANQRKQILADILGLGQYDEYESRAKELARQKREEAGRLDAQIASIDEELAREPQLVSDLQIAQAQVIEFSDTLRTVETAQAALQAERQQLLAQRRLLDESQRQAARLDRELAEVEEQLQRNTARLAADQALIARQAEIERGYGQLRAARQAEQAFNAQLAQQARLQGQQSQLEQRINQARHQLEMEQRLLGERLARLQAQAGRVADLEKQSTAAQAQLATAAAQQQRQAELRSQVQALVEENAGLQAQNQSLRAEMGDIEAKIADLADPEAPCPLCKRPLGANERAQVVSDYTARGRTLGDQFRANQTRQRAMRDEMAALDNALGEAEEALRDQARWQRQEAQVEAQLTEARQAQAEVASTEEAERGVTQRLAAGDYAGKEHAALAGVQAELSALAYDPAAHDAVRADLLSYEPFQDRYSQLQAAQERYQELQAVIERLQVSRDRWQQERSAEQARQQELSSALARLPQVEADLSARTAEVDRLAALERQARERFGAAQQKLNACRAQAQRRQEFSSQVEQLRGEQAIYEELQAAFGKKGLQAMIIEAAIPELESEANKLLGRMTDGRMAVRLETQRETKTSQELRETLDIILSDELGSRDYALFSGGEAFRANLAIRIALSKLLARRAGAQLQTLIIDEGFGTQDAQGRERLVQAITSIQDDFERVLVVTHIDELKDHFPARIEIVKTDNGSQIQVM